MGSVAGEEQTAGELEKKEEGGGGGGGGKEERILVSVRVRPLNAKEIERNDPSDWECINNNTVALKNNNLPDRSACPTVYTFDRVFGFKCSTKDVYEEGAKEVALSVVSGINATIFAYGQTSSGKTHTMIGITEHSVADIYAYIKRHEEREFLLKFSAMEIYNEAVRDLLSADASSLRLLDDPERGTIVEKLTEETLRDESHLKELLSICEAQRQIGETSLNETSSRSHQILRLTIESSTREFVSRNSTLAATVNFVDLAGSERASQSLSAGARLKEGCHINRSLLTLGTVIRKLSEGRNGHIPYRDSKLTRILQSSLGGNARTAIICTMSPARSHVEQSRNTLFFANRAKQVVTNAQVNVVMSDKALIKHLQREVARLESELSDPGSTSCTSHFKALRDKDSQIQKMEREIKELMQQRDLAQSRLDDLSTTLGDDEQSSRQWDELSQSSGVAFQSPDFYSRRFSGTSDIAYQCRDIAESRRFYAASDIAYRSPDIGSRRLCMPHKSKYGGEYHLELCGKLDKDQDISSPSHSVFSSAISGLILQQRRGKSYESLQEHIADHCKEVQCIEIHALSKSEDSSAASVIQDDDSLLSQGGVSMDLIPRMEKPSNSSSSLPKTPRVMASRELAQTRSSNSETRPMIVSPFPSDDAEQHHEKQPDALWEEFPVSPEESHKSSELSSSAVQTGDILILGEDDDAHIGSCSPGMVQSWLQKKLLDSQENQHNQVEDSEVEKIVKDVGIDSVLYPVESPSRWSFDFERKQQEIIELWNSCHVSLVHRTYFFLLFKGDPTDSIYMEVEHRRLSFLRNTSSHVHCATTIATENSHIPTSSSSLKHLRREREMLCRQMQRRLTLQERIMSYNKWGINLNSKQRRLQLAQLVWTKTETAHAGESASLVGKLIGLEEQGQALKEMFGLSFLPQQTNHRHFIWMKNKKSPSLA
ncbi:kinesin-like protein KIN-7G [Zingiber officinale]|uniref:kinesin-like protein KIN-7G n=1 Tax=Zingiber officinale TaxID=94328 RepID=UPI001C4DAE2E|nr:kinesin-like protein KIN-7G [Zingiber officinale]